MKILFLSPLLLTPLLLMAQVPDARQSPVTPPAPASTAAPAPAGDQGGGRQASMADSLPFFNPSTEMMTWNGQTWNINDNRLFQARFEKYLNAPESTDEEDAAYRQLLQQIIDKLAPAKVTSQAVDEAFRLLPQASRYDIDARLCEGIGDAVYSAWRAMDNNQRLVEANKSLEQERKRAEWNARVVTSTSTLSVPPKSGAAAREWARQQRQKRDADLLPYKSRLAEALAAIKLNQAKKELSELQTKIEFQTLIVQLFLQRRFQHVIIASRFYRSVFSDGDTTLNVGSDTKDLFAKTIGNPPTVSTLDTLANEALRDAREGVQAYRFLLERNELQSATKRLAEAFTIGEYLPELRTLPREIKRKALSFTQKSYQLVSALEVKDYTLARKLVEELEVIARDFDNSKPMAAIETARTVSAMHLAKARNAAVSGDRETLESELKAATEIWPRNPALADVSGKIFDSADVQQKALADLDQLLAQNNHRQIFEDKVRFIAATALYPDRQEQLKKVLDNMQIIEGAIIRASEIARHGDYAGAWEQVEIVFSQFPQDNKLNQVRADLTTQAAEFVRTLRTAQDLEAKGETGSSLAWYLKAQKLYPASSFGRAGIERLVEELLPDAQASTAVH
ncbi:MAG TPA: hypothetical protein VNQ90_18785 [Chthoniobacteraceae bacterium]|nr:hypothetical protein [Chthoniobacteraceae bacterium]